MKQKKNLMILLLIAVIGIVGVTIAYFSSRATFENVFETPEYGTQYIEKFTSPDNWLPGDETEKTLEVKNTGEVDEAVRVKVEEKWVNKNGQQLPLTQDGNVAAQINYINGSDWTRVDVANEDYYYYYYNYKLAPDEETSELLDKVTFNPLIGASTTCTTTTENGVTTRSCKSNGSGYDGATYTLKFTIETVQYNKYASAWNTEFAIAEEKPHPGTQFLVENATNPRTITSYNDANADKGKMFYFTHTLNEGTENEKTITETRYIGDDPYNYVYFNCADPVENQEYNYATSCEVWRILGVFDVDDGYGNYEQRIKLVKGSFIKKDQWNTESSNDWTTATLKTYLNGDYFESLQSSAKVMIDEAKYYLGSVSRIDNNLGFGSAEKIYKEERGTTRCGACGEDDSKLTWQGNVGLMYPSDEYMVYGNGVNVTCYTDSKGCSGDNAKKGWIFMSNKLQGDKDPTLNWLLSSYAGETIYVTHSNYGGGLSGRGVRYDEVGIRPVVYLSAPVQIFDGDGSEGNPYKLKK